MKSLRLTIFLLLVSTLGFSQNFSEDTTALSGYWISEKDQVIVQIYFENDNLKGKIVWLDEGLNEDGSPKRDIMNKNPELRTRLILGLDVIYGFTYKKGVWKHGRLYNIRNGHRYNAKIKVNNDGNLQWTGYYGILVFLSKTKKWERVTNLENYGLQ